MPVKSMLAASVAHHLTEISLAKNTSRTRTLDGGARNLFCVHDSTHVAVKTILLKLPLFTCANTGGQPSRRLPASTHFRVMPSR